MSEFPEIPDDHDEVESSSIEVDLYGIKAKSKPAGSSERPSTWNEVGLRLNGHLMTIAERLLGVFADAFIAVGNIVRGIGAVPDAIATRIAGAHKKADQLEAIRQHADVRSQVLLVTTNAKNESIEQESALGDVLDQLRAKGASVELYQRDDGRWVLVIVPPALVEDARRLAENDKQNAPDKVIQRVKALFARSHVLCHYSIGLAVVDGELVLTGDVDSYHHRELAAELAKQSSNMHVVNDIRVTYGES